MSLVPIPDWNSQGFLPPFNGDPTGADRAPYRVSLTDLISRFNTSTDRNAILTGFLSYRTELHKVGLTHGFQWVNGSFAEDIETLERRSPSDIDVITFFHLPSGCSSQGELIKRNPDLFVNKAAMKTTFNVDSFICQLSPQNAEFLVVNCTYWYSVWSHKRDLRWKGFLQINLDPKEDLAASAALTGTTGTGGTP